jgi:hypothetical protein
MIQILRPNLSSNILEIVDTDTNNHFYVNGLDLVARVFEFIDMYNSHLNQPYEIKLEYKNKYNYLSIISITNTTLDPSSYLYNTDLYQYATDLLTSFNQTSGNNGSTSGTSGYVLPIASSSILGGIKVGNTLSISSSGVLDVSNPTSNLDGSNGITKIGNNFNLGGIINNPTNIEFLGNNYLTLGSLMYDWNHTFSKNGFLFEAFDSNNSITFSDSGLEFKSLGGELAKFNTSILSTPQNYSFPDKSGTIALLSDIVDNTTAGSGLSISGNTIKLGGTLTENTTILTGSNLFIIGGTNGLRYTSDISSNYTNRSLIDKQYADNKVSDTVYGVGWNGMINTSPSQNAVYDKIESLSNSFIRIDGSNSPINDINWGTNSILNISTLNTGLSNVDIEDSILFYNSIPSVDWKLRQLSGGDWKIINGYDLVFQDVSNTFKTTLKTTETVDRIITFPDKTGTVALISDIIDNTTSGNGLSMSGNIVKLGGFLTENTVINGTNFDLVINVNDFIVNASTNTILLKTNNVENLKIDYNGLYLNNKKTNIVSGLSTFKLNTTNNDEAELIADNFKIDVGNDVTITSGNFNLNSGGINYASIITSGLTSNRTFQLPDVDGILITNNVLSTYETYGSNGITKTGNTFELGGTLNKNTTITTGSNLLNISGTNSTISLLANNLILGNKLTFNKKTEFNNFLLTTDNSVINILTDNIDNNTSNLYKIDLTNVINSTSVSNIGNGNRYIRTFNIKNISGGLTLGTIQSDFTETENSSTINIYISGTTLKIDVTGITSRNINWYLNVEKIKLEI